MRTVFCLAPGPSLAAEDVAAVRGRGVVIAVGDAYRLAPWADALYHTDVSWWLVHQGVPDFLGRKVSLNHRPSWRGREERFADVERLTLTGIDGLETTPTGLRSGKHSGYAALNLALHYQPTQIVLLGYDLQAAKDGTTHFFGNHPKGLSNHSPYATFLPPYETALPILAARGIAAINCSRRTALTSVPRRRLEDVLAEQEAVA